VANTDNLLRGHPPTQFKSGRNAVENGRKGGIKSGEVKRKMAMMRKELEMLLNSTPKDEESTYKTQVTVGLLANAIDKTKGGNPEAYKTIAKLLGELENTNLETAGTPDITINIVDNSNLEKALYEEDNEED
jgi:hypothetical protein